MFIRFKQHRLCFILLISLPTIGCDQVTKVVARDVLPRTGPLTYLSDHVQLEYAENPGAFLSFGAGFNQTTRLWIFLVGVTFFLLLLTYITLRTRKPERLLGVTLILAGGAGNLIDRYSFGKVTDFLVLTAGPLHTGIFNLADVAITVGAVLIVLSKEEGRAVERGLRSTRY